MNKINLKEIVDLQLSDECKNVEIDGYIYRDINKGCFLIKNKELSSKFSKSLPGSSKCWFLIDDEDLKITINDVLFNGRFPFYQFDTVHKELIMGCHLSEDTKIKGVEFKTKYSKEDIGFPAQIGEIDFNYKNIRISSKKEPEYIHSKDGSFCNSYIKTFTFSSNEDITLNEMQNLFRYFCEMLFLFYGIYPEYEKAEIILANGDICELFTYGHKFKYEKRKKHLTDNLEYRKINYEKSFEEYIKFREDSGLIFDIFLNTVYSQSFEEDYPLRFSQCIEGVMEYRKLLKKGENGKNQTFSKTIEQSINYDKSLRELFDDDYSKIEEFAKKTKEHRHLFSHAKHKSGRFIGIENKDAAIKLYTILRFIIIKECVDENYFDYLDMNDDLQQ